MSATSSNRIDRRLADTMASGRTALIPFITAGDPGLGATVPVMHALVAAGADILELGLPFSDPMADGPVIQQSSERAVARGTGIRQVLDMVATFRKTDAGTPLVIMGYLNPVEIYGVERFAQDAATAGIDGLLLVDSPPEESGELNAILETHGLHQIQLAAPTTSDQRLNMLMQASRGYLYYVSLSGVTGAGTLDHAAVRQRVEAIRKLSRLPIAVGFGVRDAQSAAELAAFSDAVVIGSALVSTLHAAGESAAAEAAGGFLAPIRAALDASG